MKNVPVFLTAFLSRIQDVNTNSIETYKAFECDALMFLRFYQALIKQDPPEKISTQDVSNFDPELLKKLTLNEVYAYGAYLKNTRKNSHKTIGRRLTTIKSLLKYLTEVAEIIDRSESIYNKIEKPRPTSKLPYYLTESEARKLLDSASENIRSYTAIYIFLTTAVRLSELINIKMNDIRPNKSLTVTGKGNKQRVIPLSDNCVKVIDKYKKHRRKRIKRRKEKGSFVDEEYLFLSSYMQKMEKSTLHRALKKEFEKAGMKECTIHKLRHTAATLLHSQGVPIRTLQKLLGHESVTTTSIYTHVSDDELRKSMEKNPLNDLVAEYSYKMGVK